MMNKKFKRKYDLNSISINTFGKMIFIMIAIIILVSGCGNAELSIVSNSSFIDIPKYREVEILGSNGTNGKDLWEYSFVYSAKGLGGYTAEKFILPSAADIQSKLLTVNPNAYVVVWRKEDTNKYQMEYEYTCRIDMNAISEDELSIILDSISISLTLLDKEGTEQTFENQLGLYD